MLDSFSQDLKAIEDEQFLMSSNQFIGGDSLISRVITTSSNYDFVVDGLSPASSTGEQYPKKFLIEFIPEKENINGIMCELDVFYSESQDVMNNIENMYVEDAPIQSVLRALPMNDKDKRQWQFSIYNNLTSGSNKTAYLKLQSIASTEGSFTITQQ